MQAFPGKERGLWHTRASKSRRDGLASQSLLLQQEPAQPTAHHLCLITADKMDRDQRVRLQGAQLHLPTRQRGQSAAGTRHVGCCPGADGWEPAGAGTEASSQLLHSLAQGQGSGGFPGLGLVLKHKTTVSPRSWLSLLSRILFILNFKEMLSLNRREVCSSTSLTLQDLARGTYFLISFPLLATTAFPFL